MTYQADGNLIASGSSRREWMKDADCWLLAEGGEGLVKYR